MKQSRLTKLKTYISKNIGGTQSEAIKQKIKKMSEAQAITECEKLIKLNAGGKLPQDAQ